jgi:hypothetical protein
MTGAYLERSPSSSRQRRSRFAAIYSRAERMPNIYGESGTALALINEVLISWDRSLRTRRWRKQDSNLYGAFPVKWLFLVCCSSLFGAGKAVLRPVACDQVRGARGRGQGTETVAQLGGLPPSVACVSQRLDA